jgi:hypothetical protein
MPFENGSVSFRMLELPRAFPENFAERFAAHRGGVRWTRWGRASSAAG